MTRWLFLTTLLSWVGVGAMTARVEADCGGVTKEDRRRIGCEQACSLMDDPKKPLEENGRLRAQCVQQCRPCNRYWEEPTPWWGVGIGAVGAATVFVGLGLLGIKGQPTSGTCPVTGLADAGCQYNSWTGGATAIVGVAPLAVGLVLFGVGYDAWKKKSR